MENKDDSLIELCKDRGYAGCIQMGLSTVTHKFNLVWKFLCPIIIIGLIINCAIGALSFYYPASFAIEAISFGVNAIILIYYLAMIAVIIRKLNELGYIPSVKPWVLKNLIVQRSLRSAAIIIAFFIFLFAVIFLLERISYIPSLKPIQVKLIETIILTVFILFCIPFGMFSTDYLLNDKTLLQTFKDIKKQFKHIGYYLIISIVAGIIATVCVMIGAIPYALTTYVSLKAQYAQSIGDAGILPNYYVVLEAISQGLFYIITAFSLLLYVFPIAFYWGRFTSLTKEPENKERETTV